MQSGEFVTKIRWNLADVFNLKMKILKTLPRQRRDRTDSCQFRKPSCSSMPWEPIRRCSPSSRKPNCNLWYSSHFNTKIVSNSTTFAVNVDENTWEWSADFRSSGISGTPSAWWQRMNNSCLLHKQFQQNHITHFNEDTDHILLDI